jgi:hypothetical protein
VSRNYINDWNTKIDASWWDEVTGPIPFKDIDVSNNSRVKGGLYSGDKSGMDHLKQIEQTIKNRVKKGLNPLELPIVIEDNPDLTSDKPFRLLIGHHRIRALMSNGYDEFDMVHLRGKVTTDDHLRRRFMCVNNDHDQPNAANSDEDINEQIHLEFKKLMDEGYTLFDDKYSMRIKVRAIMRCLVGNNKTESQTGNMVEKWVDQQVQDPNSGHVTKFKAYSNQEAKDTSVKLLGLKGLKEGMQDSETTLANANTVLYVTNTSPIRAWQYCYTARLKNPNKKIVIAAYYKTTKLNRAQDLQNKRSKASSAWLELLKLDKARCGPTKNYRAPVDQIIFLPQCVDPEDYPENENKPVLGPLG